MTKNEKIMHDFLDEVVLELEGMYPDADLQTEGMDRLQRIRYYIRRSKEDHSLAVALKELAQNVNSRIRAVKKGHADEQTQPSAAQNS